MIQVGFNETSLREGMLVEEIYLLLDGELRTSEDHICTTLGPVFAPFPGIVYSIIPASKRITLPSIYLHKTPFVVYSNWEGRLAVYGTLETHQEVVGLVAPLRRGQKTITTRSKAVGRIPISKAGKWKGAVNLATKAIALATMTTTTPKAKEETLVSDAREKSQTTDPGSLRFLWIRPSQLKGLMASMKSTQSPLSISRYDLVSKIRSCMRADKAVLSRRSTKIRSPAQPTPSGPGPGSKSSLLSWMLTQAGSTSPFISSHSLKCEL